MDDQQYTVVYEKVEEVFNFLRDKCGKKDIKIPPIVVIDKDSIIYPCDGSVPANYDDLYEEGRHCREVYLILRHEELYNYGLSDEPQINEILCMCLGAFFQAVNPELHKDSAILAKKAREGRFPESCSEAFKKVLMAREPVFENEEEHLESIISKLGIKGQAEEFIHIRKEIMDFKSLVQTYGIFILCDSFGAPKPRIYEFASIHLRQVETGDVAEFCNSVMDNVAMSARLSGDFYAIELYETDKTLLPELINKDIKEAYDFMQNIQEIIGKDRYDKVQQLKEIFLKNR